MSKDPAFLFYPGDWLGGTLGMTFEEKGAYIELLMLQFNRGHMTTHMIGQTIGQLWGSIQVKFIQDENGLWYNERLDIEKNKRKSFVSSRKNNLKGENQYTKKLAHMDGHMTTHMENENENEIRDKSNCLYDLGIVEERLGSSENIYHLSQVTEGKLTELQIRGLIKKFIIERRAKGETGQTFSQYRSYMVNWIKIYYQNNKTESKYSKPHETT